MEQTPSWEANSSSVGQEILRISWNPEFYYRIHKRLHLLLSLARAIQSEPPHPTSWRSTLTLSSNLQLDLPSGLFPSDLTIKTLYSPLLSPINATCPTHLVISWFVPLII